MTDESIFAAAVEKPDPGARAAYLDDACRGDAARRGRVDRLLAAHDRASGFLSRPPVATDATTGAFDPKPDDALGFLAPPQRAGSLGRIGHYEVLEVLGRGGFGVVFRAFDEVLQRVVAVKVLAPHMAATSPARKRFLREARSAGAVRHENVVQIHATGEDPLPFLVMEYVPGESLQQRLDRTGPLDVAEVVRTGRQIAEGLAAAHEKGLIHRDVKPANVLIEPGPQGRLKLTDFGLARAADDASLSQSGVVAGTPMYMAPEQAKGEALDHRADLFSLGSVLYALCSGRPPFRATTTLGVLKRVAEDTPRPVREIIPEVPDWLCRVVEKLHAKNPADRYQTARAVADVLADCERQLAARAKVTDLARIPPRPPGPRSSRPWSAGRVVFVLAVAALAGAIGLTAALVAAYLASNVQAPPQPANVFDLQLGDPDTEFRIVGFHDAPRTGLTGFKVGIPPGMYAVWFRRNGREFQTDPFYLKSQHWTNLRVDVTPAGGVAVLDNRSIPVRQLSGPPPGLTVPLDLIPLARPRPDLGTWRREGTSLVCGPRPGGDRTLQVLPLPVDLPAEYDFLAEVERESGADLIGFNLTAGGVGFCVVLDAWPSAGYRSGLSPLDGKDAFETDAGVKGRLLATGTRQTFRCAVRAGGVTATLDGKPVVAFAGPLARIDGRFLAYAETRNYLKVLGTDGFAVHRLRVSPPSPAAGPMREAVAAREKARDAVKLRFEAGVLPVTDLHAAEYDLAAARLKLADAEGDDEEIAARLKEMFAAARGIRDAVAERVEAGVEGPVKLAEAQIRLADATARLAKAGIPLPAPPVEPAPPPRPVR